MPIGVFTNCISVFLGGLVGSGLKGRISDNLQNYMPILFGICSIGIGITSVIKAQAMTAVVLAILVGFMLGELFHLEQWTTRFFDRLVKVLHLGGKDIDMEFYITAVALFCCSGFGWYSTLTEGITGDPSLLFSKSMLDFFAALIFAAILGKAVCAIPFPQVVILACVFMIGKLLAPILSASMFADLSACGGMITVAAGLRVSRIKSIPIVNLIPALVLVMPMSAAWNVLFS